MAPGSISLFFGLCRFRLVVGVNFVAQWKAGGVDLVAQGEALILISGFCLGRGVDLSDQLSHFIWLGRMTVCRLC